MLIFFFLHLVVATLNKIALFTRLWAGLIMVCPRTQVKSLISAAGSQHRVITHFQTQPEVAPGSSSKLQHGRREIQTSPESESLLCS